MFEINKTTTTTNEPVTISVDQELKMTELYITTRGDVIKTKHLMGKDRISSSLIRKHFKTCQKVFSYVKSLMLGEVIKTPESSHIDEEGNKIIDQKVVYEDIPNDRDALDGMVKEKFSDYHVTMIRDIVSQIIKYSDGTGENVFTSFKKLFSK